jgi:hypothetical protein
VTVAVLALVVASARAAVPIPEQDPFYQVPAKIARLANGTILNSRPVTTYYYSVPMLASAWQVQYKTRDTYNHPTADVATIMVPSTPWTGSGPRPLVSYQAAEDGVGSKCAPSYALRAGLEAADATAEQETGLMEAALQRGWAVVASDYEGVYSDFLGQAGAAHGVLDGIRAALHFVPAGFTNQTPVGLWGYSGGALATDVAAMAQPSYAPELTFAGIAVGGIVTDLKASISAFSGSAGGGVIVMAFVGIDRSYPKFHFQQFLNANGRTALAAAQKDCLGDAAAQFPFAKLSEFEAYPGVYNQPAMTHDLDTISPLWIRGTPAAPIYDYHASEDEFAPIAGDRQLMARYCAAGVPVEHVEGTGEHLTFVVTGAPGAMSYLADRFAGLPAPQNCAA